MTAAQRELLLDVFARQRLLGAAAEMRLALLYDAAVSKRCADVAGELVSCLLEGVIDLLLSAG